MKKLRPATPRRFTSLDEMPFMLSVKDLANAIGLSISKTYMLVNTKGFPRLKVDGSKRVLIPKQAFVDWMESNMR